MHDRKKLQWKLFLQRTRVVSSLSAILEEEEQQVQTQESFLGPEVKEDKKNEGERPREESNA